MVESLRALDYVAVATAALLVNTAPFTIGAVIVSEVTARSKKCTAATRYILRWLTLGFVIGAPLLWFLAPQGPPAIEQRRPVQLHSVTIPLAATVPAEQPRPVMPSASEVIVLGCIAAVCVQGLRVLLSLAYAFRLRRTARPADEATAHMFARLTEQAGTRRGTTIALSDRVSSPMMIGYLRPMVLMPAGLTAELTADEIELILLHELAHVARYDDWAIALQRVIEALCAWHPLAWYLGRRLNLDRETACDDRVAAIREPRRYASCLAKVAESASFSGANAVLAPFLQRPPELLARVELLLDRTRTHLPKVSGSRVLLASFMLLAFGFAGSHGPLLLAVPSFPDTQTASKPNIYSIVVTTSNGESSMFGDWSGHMSGESGREPGTIEFKTNNRVYVIRDSSVLAQAEQILKPMEELGRKQSELGDLQAKLGEAQGLLGDKQSKVAERQLAASDQEKLDKELRTLQAELQELDSKRMKTASDAQEKLSELQAKLADLQADMGAVQGRLGEEQGVLGEQQGKLGEQQGELGKRQGELGAQQGVESKRAEKKLKDLIRDAQARGLAQQVR